MLVTERPGRMRIVTRTGQMSAALGNVPSVYAQSQAGLMDVLLARDFDSTHTIFVCYAEPADGGSHIAVLRARLIEGENTPARCCVRNFPAKGSRLAWSPILAAAWRRHPTEICNRHAGRSFCTEGTCAKA